jgi:DNA-binding XRE family transcriptional regulator
LIILDNNEFTLIRNKLNKTQKQMAELMGTSLQAIRSYEQGWRPVPTHIERQALFLVSRLKEKDKKLKPCWKTINCPKEYRENCPSWELSTGEFCWMINGTFCKGSVQKNWKEKMKICRACEVIESLY